MQFPLFSTHFTLYCALIEEYICVLLLRSLFSSLHILTLLFSYASLPLHSYIPIHFTALPFVPFVVWVIFWSDNPLRITAAASAFVRRNLFRSMVEKKSTEKNSREFGFLCCLVLCWTYGLEWKKGISKGAGRRTFGRARTSNLDLQASLM